MTKTIFNLISTIFFACILILLYIINVVKFFECDFREINKCEIIRGIGLFTPVYIIVPFIDNIDDTKKDVKL